MNSSSPAFSFRIVGQLSIGVSRTSIRHGHTYRVKIPRPELTKFEPGHGEQIWVFTHLQTKMIIYSHEKFLKSDKALTQIPYTFKKQKPAKLRKDYWRPMALIQFAPGLGVVGRSVFQKLREFRRLHELSWGYQEDEFRNMTKVDRGKAIHNQKANSIADMAAVLGGAGKGNRIVVQEKKQLSKRLPKRPGMAEEAEKEKPALEGVEVETKDGPRKLVGATVFWDNEMDHHWAISWPANVNHILGLPERYKKNSKSMPFFEDEGHDGEEMDVVEDESEATEPKTETAQEQETKPETETETETETEPKPEPTKGVSSWFRVGKILGTGKDGSSEARL